LPGLKKESGGGQVIYAYLMECDWYMHGKTEEVEPSPG